MLVNYSLTKIPLARGAFNAPCGGDLRAGVIELCLCFVRLDQHRSLIEDLQHFIGGNADFVYRGVAEVDHKGVFTVDRSIVCPSAACLHNRVAAKVLEQNLLEAGFCLILREYGLVCVLVIRAEEDHVLRICALIGRGLLCPHKTHRRQTQRDNGNDQG